MFKKILLVFSTTVTVLSLVVLSVALTVLFYSAKDKDYSVLGPMPKAVYSADHPLEAGFYVESLDELISLMPKQGENFLFPAVDNEDLFRSSGVKGAYAWFSMKATVSYMLKSETSKMSAYSAYKITLHEYAPSLNSNTTHAEHYYYYQSRPECDTYILTTAPKDEYGANNYPAMYVNFYAMPESMFINRVFYDTSRISFKKDDYNKETLSNTYADDRFNRYNIMCEDIVVEGVDAQTFLVLFVNRNMRDGQDVFEFKSYSTFVLDGIRYFISVDMMTYYGYLDKLSLNQSAYGKVKEFARYYQEKYLGMLLKAE